MMYNVSLQKIPLISSLQVFCRKSSGTTAIQCISIRPFASQKIILSIINKDQRAEYLDFVSSHSLKTREKYTNWDNLACLSLYIFWAQSHLCLLLQEKVFCKCKHRWLCPQKIYKLRQIKLFLFVYFSLVLREWEEKRTKYFPTQMVVKELQNPKTNTKLLRKIIVIYLVGESCEEFANRYYGNYVWAHHMFSRILNLQIVFTKFSVSKK